MVTISNPIQTKTLEELMEDVAQKRRTLGAIGEKLDALDKERLEARDALMMAEGEMFNAVNARIGVGHDGKPL